MKIIGDKNIIQNNMEVRTCDPSRSVLDFPNFIQNIKFDDKKNP